MGIVFTKYEDTDNNNIVFDSSKFDYSYDSDPFPADTATDFENIILEQGDIFFVTRPTTTKDSMGTVSDISDTDFRIFAYISDISKKDRMVHDMGLAVPGNRIMYVKPEYSIISAGVAITNEVREGDILKDRNDEKWRVIKIIQEPYINGTQIYKKSVVQSIGLKGSA